MANGYRGAGWPLNEMWTDAYGGEVAEAFKGHQAMHGPLRDEFDQRVSQVKANQHLTDTGKAHQLRQLAAEYRSHKVVVAAQTNLGKLRAREQKVRQELSSRPTPDLDKLSAYQAVSLAMAEGRTIARFESLSSHERLQAVRIASEKGDTKFLSP
jgi:hypothetical protein